MKPQMTLDAALNPEVSFGALNYAVLVIYLAAMVAIGVLLAGRQKSTDDYFLAGRNMPWLAVALSIFASLVSAVSYMGVPGCVYTDNISILAGICMLPVVAPILILWFYPVYRRLNVTTSYEYVYHRFGQNARYAVSSLFLLGRLGWLGTVIFAPALALSTVTSLDLWLSILIMGGVGTLYTVLGGLAAVIWTDVAQFFVLALGIVWLAVALILEVPGGMGGVFDLAAMHGKLDIGTFRVSLVEMTLSGVAISYFLSFLHDYGIDQVTVQRLLATRDLRSMARATLLSAVVNVVLMSLLAFVGLALFAWHQADPSRLPAGLGGDRVLPYYIMHALPAGISGLLIAGVFAAAMSSLDSGINSLSTVVINDFLRPLRGGGASETGDLRLAKILTVVFGALATATAFYAASLQQILRASQFFLGLFTGPILAIFMLGMLTRRGSFTGWLIGLAAAIPTSIWVQHQTDLHFVYYFPLSFFVAFGVGYAASRLVRDSRSRPEFSLRQAPPSTGTAFADHEKGTP